MWTWLKRLWWDLRDAVLQRVCSHGTVVREWEWTPLTDEWRQRREWTCDVCGKDFLLPPGWSECKQSRPPERADELRQLARRLWTEQQAESVRVRGFEDDE